MSKYILAGEPINLFCKRGGISCWVVESRKDAIKLSHMIGAKMVKKNIKGIKYHTSPLVWEEKNCVSSVKYCLVVSIPLVTGD